MSGIQKVAASYISLSELDGEAAKFAEWLKPKKGLRRAPKGALQTEQMDHKTANGVQCKQVQSDVSHRYLVGH